MKDEKTKKKIACALWIFFAVLPIYSIIYNCYSLFRLFEYFGFVYQSQSEFAYIIVNFIGIAMLFVFIGVFYLSISKVFHAVYKDVPIFDEANVKRIKMAAIARLAIYVVSISTNILLYITYSSMFSPDVNAYIGFATGLMPPLIYICLAYVFDYGAAMQRESDETL